MGQWIEPKTNWGKSDYFNLDPDYVRIKGNILYLHELVSSLYAPFSLQTMKDYSISDIPRADFFNAVEDNVQRLADGHFRPYGFIDSKYYIGNEAPWNQDDLNRIENNLLLLFRAFESQQNGKRELPYALGCDVRV